MEEEAAAAVKTARMALVITASSVSGEGNGEFEMCGRIGIEEGPAPLS